MEFSKEVKRIKVVDEGLHSLSYNQSPALTNVIYDSYPKIYCPMKYSTVKSNKGKKWEPKILQPLIVELLSS